MSKLFFIGLSFTLAASLKQKLIIFNWRKNMTDTLELAAVIKALRQELINAQQEGTGKDIRFNVNSVEIELETVVEIAGDGKGGFKIKFGVVEANAEAGGHYKNATKQKIKLSLKPKDSQGKDIDLSGDE
jgi:lipopolysaccharide export system protein LptA